MSDEYVFTQGDILIEPYKFQKIKKLKITRELNEHAKLCISGIISDENSDKYVEEAKSEEIIKVSAKDNEDNEITLFEGIVTKIGIEMSNDVRSLEVEALSNTFLMDIKKINGSYQDKHLTYREIFEKKNCRYSNAQMVDNITNKTKIDKFVVQYKETDWEFLKRLASHFNTALVPECQLSGMKYSIGGAGEAKVYEINEFNYAVQKGLQEYNVKASNEDYELDDINLISYEVETNKIMGLYNKTNFKGRTLLVYKCEIEMIGGVLSNKYILRDENGMKVKKTFNNKLVGVSLQGRVLDTQKDRVKVSLEIDGSPTERAGVRWFEFSTIFSQPNGTGWYCMPEVEDVVRLYFPDNEEKNGYVISSMHYDGIDDSKRSDPSVKSLSTKYGKEIIMRPGGIDVISGGNAVSLSDDGGIEVNSDEKIILDAKDDIEIHSGAKIQIKGNKGIKLTQGNANMLIRDDITMSGGKVNVQD